MSIAADLIMNKLSSYCSSSGLFDSVTTHEPKSAPARTGVSASIWVSDFRPTISGLSATSMRLEFVIRMYTSMLQEPVDMIDLVILNAADQLLSLIIGNFDLDVASVRYVDVRGTDGEPVRVLPGYISQDSKVYRTLDLYCPVLCNDTYQEVA